MNETLIINEVQSEIKKKLFNYIKEQYINNKSDNEKNNIFFTFYNNYYILRFIN